MKRTDLIIRICALLIVAAGFIALYLKIDSQGISIDREMYESLHGHGSLNVVIAVITIILSGLFITLFRIDRKVSKLEEEIKERKS